MTPARRERVADGLPGESAAERRHWTLPELKLTVRHHPAVVIAPGAQGDAGRVRERELTFDPLILGVDADRAALRIEWRPRPDSTDPAYFVFHSHDSPGRDFGCRREPNPHVDGLEHYHERTGPDQESDYAPADVHPDSPVDLLWDILGRIEQRVSGAF